MTERTEAERRARRLLRWYPKVWSQRYGDEFKELLIADILEHPRSWRRTRDVARRGLAVRSQRRPALAYVLLVAILVCCGWIIGTWVIAPAQIACGTHCTPEIIVHIRATQTWRQTLLGDARWVMPLAIAIGAAGTVAALHLHRPRSLSPQRDR